MKVEWRKSFIHPTDYWGKNVWRCQLNSNHHLQSDCFSFTIHSELSTFHFLPTNHCFSLTPPSSPCMQSPNIPFSPPKIPTIFPIQTAVCFFTELSSIPIGISKHVRCLPPPLPLPPLPFPLPFFPSMSLSAAPLYCPPPFQEFTFQMRFVNQLERRWIPSMRPK